MNLKYKYLIFVLIFIISFDISCYILLFNFSLGVVKKEGEIKISEINDINNLDVLVLKKEDLQSIDLSKLKEINHKGVMYDVYRIVEENSQVILYCIKDEKETKLLKNYSSFVSQTKNSQKKQIINNISIFFTPGIINNFTYQLQDKISQFYFYYSKNSLVQIYITPPSPPPKIIV